MRASMLKLWLETRAGFLLVLAMVLVPLVASGAASAPQSPEHWQRMMQGPLFILLGAAALVLGDAGVWAGAMAPPSIGYTLSLPVSRRSIVLGRVLVGLVQSAVVMVSATVTLWTLCPSIRSTLTPAATLTYVALVLGGQLLFCGVRVLVSTALGPAWSFLAALVVFVAALATRVNVRWLPDGHVGRETFELLFPLMAPHPGASLLLCVLGAVALVGLAIARVERDDF